jgi:peptidoglycan/LPS O-acetylase OafA/YrhL
MIISNKNAIKSTHAYRPDIDGLRAVAILAVVIFHAFPAVLSGGFIGVDVFFVLSGFLITTIILHAHHENNFSFASFYGRRIRRIFPALLLVLIFSLIAAICLLTADEVSQISQHILGGASFSANFVFWQEAGYFDAQAITKPLLHLWSLSIEEQFYIIWPLCIWYAIKKQLNVLVVTIALAALSFTLNVYWVYTGQIAAFYAPQARIWELLIGCSIAYSQFSVVLAKLSNTHQVSAIIHPLIHKIRPAINPTKLANIQACLGLTLLLVGLFTINKDSYFPGWRAFLFPVLGSALIITAGESAWFNRAVLSNKALIWLGLISYPLYLWHWPLLSFAHILSDSQPSTAIKVLAVAIAIMLAWLTYYLIEIPIRTGLYKKLKTTLLMIGMILIAGLSYYSYHHYSKIAGGNIFITANKNTIKNERLRYWSDNTSVNFSTHHPKVVIFGDSQAWDIFTALRHDNTLGLKMFKSNYDCAAFFDIKFGKDNKKTLCQTEFDHMLNSTELKQADVLVYSHLWTKAAENADAYAQGLAKIKQKNPNIQIYFFGQKPMLGKEWLGIDKLIPQCPNHTKMDSCLNQMRMRDSENIEYAKKLASINHVSFVDVDAIYCLNGCEFFANKQFNYFDQSHWTKQGAKVFFDHWITTESYRDLSKQ